MTIDARGNAHRPEGAPDGGKFARKANTRAAGALTESPDSLATMEPSDIDTQLAELHYQVFKLDTEAAGQAKRIQLYQRTLEPGQFEKWVGPAQEKLDEAYAAADTTREQMRPLEAEFDRRGGWSRAFLVTGGHLHNTMSCSTCNRMGQPTRFAWMPQFSGADEDEMVDAAADRCCTVCFPSAPVDVLQRPSALLTPDEEEAARARAEREAVRSQKAEEKAAKSIANPDGSELREPGRYGQVVRTLATAERELTDALVFAIEDDVPEMSHWNRELVAERAQWADQLVAAIAAKKSISEDAVREAAQVKAAAKFRRENR